jgi:hypothetical protein
MAAEPVGALGMEWFELKQHLSDFTGLSKDALHIHAAILIHIAAALLLRSSLSRIGPWLAVLLILTANEYYDLRIEEWPDRTEQYWNGFHDLWNTMTIPTVVFLLSRYAPGLFRLPEPRTNVS